MNFRTIPIKFLHKLFALLSCTLYILSIIKPDSDFKRNLLEHCTDGPDAFDTLYISCE